MLYTYYAIMSGFHKLGHKLLATVSIFFLQVEILIHLPNFASQITLLVHLFLCQILLYNTNHLQLSLFYCF